MATGFRLALFQLMSSLPEMGFHPAPGFHNAAFGNKPGIYGDPRPRTK
jgi:hypothetical protein